MTRVVVSYPFYVSYSQITVPCVYSHRIEKTKEMRRPSTHELSSHDSSDSLIPERRKDLLLNVIKSDNFRKLLSARSEYIWSIYITSLPLHCNIFIWQLGIREQCLVCLPGQHVVSFVYQTLTWSVSCKRIYISIFTTFKCFRLHAFKHRV